MDKEYQKINLTRFLLMIVVCMISFGIPVRNGSYIRLLCGGATICFYIFSGFLITREDAPLDQKLARAIGHTALLALAMLVLNLIANAIYYRLMGASLLSDLAGMARSKRIWFEFIAMNFWHLPLGENFWFIQSLLYAYIAMYILEKLHLLEYDWLIFALCITVTVLTGEFAGLVGFHALGYTYISANFLTRALPYLLLGKMLRTARERIVLHNIAPFVFLLLIPLGAVLSFVEIITLDSMGKLVYTGHFIGNGIMAAGLCLTVILEEYRSPLWWMPPSLGHFLRRSTTFIYATHQILGFAVMMTLGRFLPALANLISPYLSFVVFALGLLLSIPAIAICSRLTGKRRQNKMEDAHEAEV